MIEIADREILPHRQLEILAAHRQHDRALQPGRPHQRPIDQPPHMLQHRITSVGRLGKLGVAALAQRDGERPANPRIAQPVQRVRHQRRIVGRGTADLHR